MQAFRAVLILAIFTNITSAVVEHSLIEYKPPVSEIAGKVVGWGTAGSGVQIDIFRRSEVGSNSSPNLGQHHPPQDKVQTLHTGRDGQFKVRHLPKGTYEVQFYKEGWDTLSINIRVDPSASATRLCVNLRISGATSGASVEKCH